MGERPRKVLHLIDTGGPGGAETVFLQLVRRLPADRWRSLAVVPWRDDWLHQALLAAGVEPVVLQGRGSFDLRYLAGILRLVRSSGAELIQAHLPTAAVYASVAGRILGIPTVGTFHGPADLPEDLRFEAVKMRLLDRVEGRVVLVSEGLRRWFLERTGLPAARTRVVSNGIDRARFGTGKGGCALRDALGIDADELLVGALGNVRASKDYATLLRAAARVVEAAPVPVRFVVAGHGDPVLEKELARLHGALRLGERFRFLGFQEDAPAFLEALDVYVLSSSAEGFSLSTVEAMASGLPVVATRCGGPEEIVTHGRDGWLVPPRDPAALGEALLRLAGDPAERDRLGRAARASVAARYSVETMVAGYEAVYEELLAPGNRG